ncbi:Alpha/Beta hydrolase protein [Gorgonomyces haynaldii]|nr:Alpha/Beta hydrolase protein [Gorgonomyces haynaldii]
MQEVFVKSSSGFDIQVLHYPAKNQKQSILFVHGGFHAAWCWELWMQYFAKNGYQTMAISLRGHGKTTSGSSWFYSLSQWAQDVRDVVQDQFLSKNLEHPIIIGHSAGTGVTQKYLDLFQPKCPLAVLVCPFPGSGGMQIMINWASTRFLPLFIGMLLLNPYLPLSNPDLAKEVFLTKEFPDDQAQVFHQKLEKSESVLAPMSMTSRYVNLERVKKYRIWVVGGKQDVLMTESVVKKCASDYGSPIIWADKCGHNVMMDVGWQQAAKQLLDKLDDWYQSQFSK